MADENVASEQAPDAVTQTIVNGADTAVDTSNETPHKDVAMTEAAVDLASPAPANVGASPAPARTGTPAQASRAPSVHPDPGFTLPSEAAPNGDSTRRYLNNKVTGALLEGMKMLAKEQPDDPLRVLGEYLIQKSKEIEGSN
ncbi:COMPASS complex subunit Sdc1, putative [Cordyceps militaris CM01]|uniref:COMPASS complex subunit Sdc1, putative n=1 Tax=Cordyceps militaris (strain CM01) TaxID=983644 RepID=G3J8N1_CORMM|nr:COMPASS complex subunit Sdc1, putative [Cordyceps militaris CM01]EGX93966.1 COMPASS complex subunit Sdc1, putative [Cordyceps militaris CM01]